MEGWSFLTNHGRVLLCIAHDPGVRLRDIAARVGITERSAFGIDVTLVRVIVAVVSVLTGGAGILAYLAAWVIVPEEGDKNPAAEHTTSQNQDAWSS